MEKSSKDGIRIFTVEKSKSTSKDKKNGKGVEIDKKSESRKVSFQLTEAMMAKLKQRPPSGETTDTRTPSQNQAKNHEQRTITPATDKSTILLKNNEIPHFDLLAEAKKRTFFTSWLSVKS